MNNTFLVGSNTIKATSMLDVNVSDDMILPIVKKVQDLKVRDILGKELLDKLVSIVYNKEVDLPINDKYKDLILNYIQPYMTQEVLGDMLIPIEYKIRNKGVLNTSDDKTNNVSLSDINYYREYYRNDASGYKSILINKICLDFGKEIEKPTKDVAKCNIWLG